MTIKGIFTMSPKFFPTLLIIIDILAAIGYIGPGDWRKVCYWLAAAVLTFVVTW
jgi:hypothetical protein